MEDLTAALDGGNSEDLSELSRSPTPASTKSGETDVEEGLSAGKHVGASISVFDMITSELFKIGAIPLERFATEDYPEEENMAPIETSLVKPGDSASQAGDVGGNAKGRRKEHFQAVAKIYEACMRTFENSDAIIFDYKDDSGPNARECILTITRPDGRSRSYTSGPFFSNKSDAKAHVASVAIGLNVINFIKYGDVNSKSRSNPIVESLDAPVRLKAEDGKGLSFADQRETDVDDVNVRSISECCVKWRAGLVKPIYVHFSEPTVMPRLNGKKSKALIPPTEDELMALRQGCALKIEISQHTTRVYSVHHIYKTRAAAKAAVAAVAIKQGVLDFIKYANGQTAPTVFVRELEGDPDENLNREIINETNAASKEVTIDATAVNITLKKHQIPLDAMTLQAFTNSLPKPFPETPGLKPTGEGNPVGWLNAAAQSARGSRMTITWTYLSNAKLSSHGCLVRFNLPRIEEGRSYLVEPQFTKRSDAKSAVALLAISQNVGGWVHEISTAVENLITPEMRTKAGSLMAPLNQECTRARIVGQPTYSYIHEEGAVGCTLRVEFSSDLWKEYKVPVQYRTKPDARLAAILQAHHAGVVEFIRFKGADPPADYHPEQPYDWKIARKIEEAQARGGDSSMAKGEASDSADTQVVRTGHSGHVDDRDAEMEGLGWGRPNPRSQGSQQYNWAAKSPADSKGRDFSRSAPPRGGHSMRGRFSEGGSGFRGKNNPGQQRGPSRRYSGPEINPRSSGNSRGAWSGSYGARNNNYADAEDLGGPRSPDQPRFRGNRRPVPDARPSDYDYTNTGGSDMALDVGYGRPQYAPPPGPLPYEDHYYPLPPLGVDDGYRGYPSHPDAIAYPPAPPGIDPYVPRSFYPPMQPPPVPQAHGHPGWQRADEAAAHYSYPPPPPSGYYDDYDYSYDEEPPLPDDEWRDDRGDRGRFRDPEFHEDARQRFDTQPRDRSPNGSPNRYEGSYSNHNQRHKSGFSRGRGRGAGRGTAPRQYQGSGAGPSSKSAENTPHESPEKVLPHGMHSKPAGSRWASGDGPRKSNSSPRRANHNSSPGMLDREQSFSRKRPREPSPTTAPPAPGQGYGSGAVGRDNNRPKVSPSSGEIGRPGQYELALADHCTRNSIRQPIFKHEAKPNGTFNVSVIVDREKFSLPTPFESISGGREEVAKQVLNRVKGAAKR